MRGRYKLLGLILLCLFFFIAIGHSNFLLIGQPGSGKGTLSAYLVEKAGYRHICPGDIIRTHLKHNTKLGQIIRPGFESGKYVEDSILFNMIKEPVEECIQNKRPFIIDGFPRNNAGLDFLIILLKYWQIESEFIIINFKIDDSICMQRIRNRIVCFNCYKVYNLDNNRPKHDLTCDDCNTSLEVRTGDTEEVVKRRLLHFHNNIEPMIELLKKEFLVINFASNNNLNDCIAFYNSLLLIH